MNVYKMCINNVVRAIRKQYDLEEKLETTIDHRDRVPNAFESSEVLAVAFCKSKEDVLADLLHYGAEMQERDTKMKKDPCPNCGATKELKLVKDIGWDISSEGEERQHLQKCKCGYRRFVIDFYSFDPNENYTRYGQWFIHEEETRK